MPNLCFNCFYFLLSNTDSNALLFTLSVLLIFYIYLLNGFNLLIRLFLNLLGLKKKHPVLLKSEIVGSADILTQTDTHQASAHGSVTIGIEGHTLKAAMCRSCAEIRRFGISTPFVTLFVTVGVTGNKKPGVERMITD